MHVQSCIQQLKINRHSLTVLNVVQNISTSLLLAHPLHIDPSRSMTSRPSENFRDSRRQLVESQSKGFALPGKRTVRELIEPLTETLANTHQLEPGNLEWGSVQ